MLLTAVFKLCVVIMIVKSFAWCCYNQCCFSMFRLHLVFRSYSYHFHCFEEPSQVQTLQLRHNSVSNIEHGHCFKLGVCQPMTGEYYDGLWLKSWGNRTNFAFPGDSNRLDCVSECITCSVRTGFNCRRNNSIIWANEWVKANVDCFIAMKRWFTSWLWVKQRF